MKLSAVDGESVFFFFNDTSTTEIYTLSLHDALPISPSPVTPTTAATVTVWSATCSSRRRKPVRHGGAPTRLTPARPPRSEEHTSELQSRQYLVCRLLLEKKKKNV